MLGMSSMMGDFAMSSLVDNILLLNFVELGDTLRTALTVGKMRSNPCSRVSHECEVVDGEGMRVLPRELTASVARMAFSGYHSLISRSPVRA
jgi:KaiC/GvpD/RAD55 family RecA-like ATPase